MKIRKIVLFLLFVFNYTVNHAQIPDGSIAPDFEVVDIFGETHHLYTYLDEGKTVIIEIAATWCSPCWSYAQLGSLESAYQIMGSNGLDNIVVLFVEGEPENGIDQLHGIVGSSGNPYADLTHGNWTEIIHYPIINSSAIADLYDISYYPTIFKICPNEKIVTELDQVPVSNIIDDVLNTDCMTPTINHDMAILRYKGTESVCENTTIKAPIEIINLGQSMSSPSTIEVSTPSGIVAVDTVSGLLPSFERKVIQFDAIELNDATELNFRLHNELDDCLENNFLDQSFQIAPKAMGETLQLTLQTDAYGFETYWEIRNVDGTVFYTGGNTEVGIQNGGPPYVNAPYAEGALENLTEVVYTLYLSPNDCYELVMVDDYGDGICCEYGDGFYEVTDGMGNTLISGGLFSDYIIHSFAVEEGNATSTDNTVPVPVICYPNPASAMITLDQIPTESEPLSLEIYNLMGQPVHQQMIATNQITLSTIDYPKGIYLVYLISKKGNPIYTQKVTIQ